MTRYITPVEKQHTISNEVKKNLPMKETGWPNNDKTLLRKIYFYYTGAGNGDRTRDPQLGRLMLYHLSYSRI